MRKLAGILIALGVILGFAVAAHATDTNQVQYWEDKLASYGVDADCFKHEAYDKSVHGVNNGTSVTLNAFDPNWEQDFWALIVVKGGNSFIATANPVAGVAYTSPTNNGGQVSDVSHWIVCKGRNKTVDTTTTTLQETTTSVTIPVESTVVDSTVPGETTSTVAGVVTTVNIVPPIPFNHGIDLTSTNQGLPETGSGERWAALLSALALIIAGITMLIIRKREYA